MLQQLPEFQSSVITRTRDSTVLAKMDCVVDVGGVYDPEKLRFDHHQREFQETFSPNHTIRLSSAGLVYKHFGLKVLPKVIGIAESDPNLKVLYDKIYDDYVMTYDAVDNGVSQFETEAKPKYRTVSDIFARVSRLNPNWNERNANPDMQFMKAVELVGQDFSEVCSGLLLGWLPAKQLVSDAYNICLRHNPNILILQQSCPWKEHLLNLEAQNGRSDTLYAIYPDETNNDWRVQAVPSSPDSFESRLPFPKSWRGLRLSDLDSVAGISNCVFVHASGFIGGNKSLEGCIKMAEESIKMDIKAKQDALAQ